MPGVHPPGVNPAYRILVLGGYGHFGGRICAALANDVTLIIAGRDGGKAAQFARALGAAHDSAALDHNAVNLGERVHALNAAAVVHTCGPFQGQDYHVAQACIAAGAHYIDLADGRAFVVGISALDAAARARDVLVASGASTVPALSSAVIDEHLGHFAKLDSIDISITPGHRTPRGLATLQAVMSYAGKPFTAWEQGRWQTVYGWQDIKRFRYPGLGSRWLARCDVPDLQLFPQRYAGVQRVRFDAALELPIAQAAFWLLAALVRLRLISDASRYAPLLLRCAHYFDGMGTDSGGMHVGLSGVDHQGRPANVDWHLTAHRGHGPQIPCIAAIVLARKLATGMLAARGAMPCVGLMSLAEFTQAVAHLDISSRTSFT